MLLRSQPAKSVATSVVVALACWFAVAVAPSATGTVTTVDHTITHTTTTTTTTTTIPHKQKQKRRRAEDYQAANDDANDDGEEEQEDEEDSIYSLGIMKATGCASYTIALENENRRRVSVVGQETVLFFEYAYEEKEEEEEENYNDDYNYNNDDVYNYNNRRNLEENDDDDNQNQQNYYYNYYANDFNFKSNAILATDWLVAFSSGTLSNGCLPIEDPISVFRGFVPSIDDGSLLFSSTLYYGPICASDDGNSNINSGSNSGSNSDSGSNSTTTPVFGMGVFVDSSCNAYVPGLSRVLNQNVLSDWTTGVSVRGSSSNSNNDDNDDNDEEGEKSNSYHYYYSNDDNDDTTTYSNSNSNGGDADLSNLDSYKTLIHQLNYYHNRDATDCQSYPSICQQVSETSFDLNTCQSLASELLSDEGNNNDNGNNDDDDDEDDDDGYGYGYDEQVIQETANDYGEFVFITTDKNNNNNNKNGNDKNNEEEEAADADANADGYFYQMFQQVLEDYTDCSSSDENNGNDDDGNENDDDADNDDDCYQGICFGILQSSSKGYSLGEWLEANAETLDYELSSVYRVGKYAYSFALWYEGLVAICGILLLLLVALAFWTEGIAITTTSDKSSIKKAKTAKKRSFLRGAHRNSSHPNDNSPSSKTIALLGASSPSLPFSRNRRNSKNTSSNSTKPTGATESFEVLLDHHPPPSLLQGKEENNVADGHVHHHPSTTNTNTKATTTLHDNETSKTTSSKRTTGVTESFEVLLHHHPPSPLLQGKEADDVADVRVQHHTSTTNTGSTTVHDGTLV